MEVIEDGNIMDRIPILLQRDLEYYQTNQTVLSESVCPGVVGGRLDFPRTASFAAVKIVIWLEDEFSIAFKRGSGMFVLTEEDDKGDLGVAKTSDPDKFVQLAIKSSDMLLEHLHVLVQEALDHADLPVLTSTLGASALVRNALQCYVQVLEDLGSSERHSLFQACYKRYVTMSEAVAERVLDLHNRVLSLYLLQDSGGRPVDDQSRVPPESGSPSIQGWWLYMQGTKKGLWDTVPPRMAQRIFAGMLNETLTILTVRYCQTNTTDTTTALLINDILNILLCTAQLLPAICSSGSDLAGFAVSRRPRDVRDVHAKCNELFKCMVFRGSPLHFIHQAFQDKEDMNEETVKDCPFPWFTFVSPNLFETFDDVTVKSAQDLPKKTAVGLELQVLLALPQPSWSLVVKVLMMRNCHLLRMLLIHAIRRMSVDNSRWPARGLWYSVAGRPGKCAGFLCTADGFCKFKAGCAAEEEYDRAAGALTHVLATTGNKAEMKSSLMYALEISARDWAACLDKRQVWCDRRPPWLAALLSLVGSTLQFIPTVLVKALQSGASLYQTVSVCLSCIERSVACLPRALHCAAGVVQDALPPHVQPVGGSVLLQMLVTVVYEELLHWAREEAIREKAAAESSNGDLATAHAHRPRSKHVRIAGLHNTASSSVSFDGSHSSRSSLALVVAEALCCVDEDDKHTLQLTRLVECAADRFTLSDHFGLEDFPHFGGFAEEGTVPGANAERTSDAAVLTSQLLMTPPGRDSLRVIYNHLQHHAERIYRELGVDHVADASAEPVPVNKAPLLYIMFHIGRRPFDEYLRGGWPMPWSRLSSAAQARSGVDGARVHVSRRADVRAYKVDNKTNNQALKSLCDMFKARAEGVL